EQELVVDHRAAPGVERHLDAVRAPGLRQQLRGLGRNEGVRLERGVVAEVGVGDAAAERLALPRVEVLDDRADVERVVERLARTLVGERRLRAVDRERDDTARRYGEDLRGAAVGDGLDTIGRDVRDDVRFAFLECHDPREVLGDRFPDHAIDRRRPALPAPPVPVGLHDQALVLHPFDELVGARAHGAPGQLLHTVVGRQTRRKDLRSTRTRSNGSGFLVTIRIVVGFTIWTASIVAKPGWTTVLPGWRLRSRVALTSSAVSGAPSWNLTPWRNVNSQVVSLTFFHEVARPGCRRSELSQRVSAS